LSSPFYLNLQELLDDKMRNQMQLNEERRSLEIRVRNLEKDLRHVLGSQSSLASSCGGGHYGFVHADFVRLISSLFLSVKMLFSPSRVHLRPSDCRSLPTRSIDPQPSCQPAHGWLRFAMNEQPREWM
jgi:hypothetical protein